MPADSRGTPAFAGAGKPGDDIEEPTALASQRAIALEGWGEEEQSARAAPDDLLTSYPGTGRKSALLGRVRTCQGAC